MRSAISLSFNKEEYTVSLRVRRSAFGADY
jgi:hypothetical protein